MVQDSFHIPVQKFELLPQSISADVLLEKYAKERESSVADVYARVAQGLASVEAPHQQAEYAQAFWQT